MWNPAPPVPTLSVQTGHHLFKWPPLDAPPVASGAVAESADVRGTGDVPRKLKERWASGPRMPPS